MKRRLIIITSVFLVAAIAVTLFSFANITQKENTEPPLTADLLSSDGQTQDAVHASNSVYQDNCDVRDPVYVKLDGRLTKENISQFLDVESYLGSIPQAFSVTETAKGYYTVTPEQDMTAGCRYTFTAMNGAFLVAEGTETITTVTKRIAKADADVVELQDGIVYVDWEDVQGNDADTISSVSAGAAGGISEGSVLCLMNGYNQWKNAGGAESERAQLYNDDTLFVRVESLSATGNGKDVGIRVVDAEPEDVYENVDVSFTRELNPAEMVDTNAIENAVLQSQGTQRLTELLGAAIAQDETVRAMLEDGGESTTPFRSGVGYEKGISANIISGLRGGLSVTATVSNTATNPNFGVADPDGWMALAITVNYNATIKNNVLIRVSLPITQYLNINMQGYKSWDNNDFNFDYALNMYTQTNFDLTVLVCSTNEGSKLLNRRNATAAGTTTPQSESTAGKWFDISESIKEHLNAESSDSQNIVAQLKELLEAEGGYIDLVDISLYDKSVRVIPELPVFSVNLHLDYVLRINFAAGISGQMTVLDAVQVGMEGSTKTTSAEVEANQSDTQNRQLGYKGIRSYQHELAGANRYSYDLYAAGYVGIRTGLRGQLTLSFLGLDRLGEVGIELEVGAYVDCYGYLHLSLLKESQFSSYVDKQFYGGYFIDLGIYLQISLIAKSEVFDMKAGVVLLDQTWSLATFGNRYVFYGLESTEDSGDYFMSDNSVPLSNILDMEGKYLDLTTGELESRPIESVLQNATVTFSDNDAFSLQDDCVVVDPAKVYKYTPGASGSSVEIREKTNKTVCTMQFTYNGPSLTGRGQGVTKEYKLYWADWTSGIGSIEDFYKTYKVGFALELDDGTTVALDSVQYAEAGTSVHGFRLTEQERQLYYIYGTDDTAPEEEYDCTTFCKTPTSDVVYTLKATRRQTYAAFVCYDVAQQAWVSEIRICNVGDAAPCPEVQSELFSGWSSRFADNTITQMPAYDLYGYEPNTLVGKCTVDNPGDMADELNAFAAQKGIVLNVPQRSYIAGVREGTLPFSDIYTFRAQYRDCTVTFYSGAGIQTTQRVAFGKTYSCQHFVAFDPNLGTLLGWDADNDGTADVTGTFFPVATEETILYYAVYGAELVSVKVLSGDDTQQTELQLYSDDKLVFTDGNVSLKCGSVTTGFATRKAQTESAFATAKANTASFGRWGYSYQALYNTTSGCTWENPNGELTVGYAPLVLSAVSRDAVLRFATPIVEDVNGNRITSNTYRVPLEGTLTAAAYSGASLRLSYGNLAGDVNIPLYYALESDDGYYQLRGWLVDGTDMGFGFYTTVKGEQTLTPVYRYYANQFRTEVDSCVDFGITSADFTGLVQIRNAHGVYYSLKADYATVTAFAQYIRTHLPADTVDAGKEYYYDCWELEQTYCGREYVYRMGVYRAPYNYTVTFDANGGYMVYPATHPTSVSIQVENGSFRLGDYIKYADYSPVRYGDGVEYTVDYWTDANNGYYTADSYIDLHSNITLWPCWSAEMYIELHTSDVDIGDFADGMESERDVECQYLSEGLHSIEELMLPTQNDASSCIYRVTAWKNEDTGEVYGLDDTFTVTGPTTFTAVWELTDVLVKFEADSFLFTGECNINDGWYDPGSEIFLPIGTYRVSDFPQLYERYPYTGFVSDFEGWRVKGGNGTVYTNEDTFVLSAPTVFQPVTTVSYCSVSICFDANGGNIEGSYYSQKDVYFLPGTYTVKTAGDDTTLLDFPIVTKEDAYAVYEFTGWELFVLDAKGNKITEKTLLKPGDTYTAPTTPYADGMERPYGFATAQWKLSEEISHNIGYACTEGTHCLRCLNEGCDYVVEAAASHSMTDGICTVCSYYQAPKCNGQGYYEISNKGELYWFADKLNAEGISCNAVMTADIAFDQEDIWLPMGDAHWDYEKQDIAIVAYTGVFDGNGHTISGMHIDYGDCNGFIQYLASPGVIKNVHFAGTYVGNSYSSAVVVAINGRGNAPGGLIENCLITDHNICEGNDWDNTATVCGTCYSGTVRNCLVLAAGEDGCKNLPMTVTEASEYDYPAATVENCFYVNEGSMGTESDDIAGTVSVTEGELRNGKIAYLLRSGTDGDLWGHNDPEGSEEAFVVPSLGGKAVYRYTHKDCASGAATEYFTGDASMEGKTIANHSYRWNYDAMGHWQECTAEDCTEKCNGASHSFEGNTCSVCGYVKGAAAVSGVITSFGEEGTVTLTLYASDGTTVVAQITVSGNAAQYSLADIPDGSYLLCIAKENHGTVEMPLTVSGDSVVADAALYPYGDMNGNGATDTDDAIYLLKSVFDNANYPIAAGLNPDCNGDKTVSSDDAIYLLKHVFAPEYYPLCK